MPVWYCFWGLLLWLAAAATLDVHIQPITVAITLLVIGSLFFLFYPVLRRFLRRLQRGDNADGYKLSFPLATLLILGGILSCSTIQAQVTGTVFRDFDGDGFKDSNEPLVSGVIVSAYLANSNTPCGTATSAGTSAPNFSVSGCSTADVRVEFEIPTSGTCANSSIDFTSLGGTTYGSSVQFVQGNSTNVNFAIHNPADYNTGAANTSAYIPRYVNGDPLPSGSAAGSASWFYGFGYNTTGDPSTPPTQSVGGAVLGSTWGVAYSKQAKKIFVAAFIKRHVGLGSQGSGGIYLLEPTANSFNVSEFYNMDVNGYRTRADELDPATPAYGSGTSYFIASNSVITYQNSTNDPLSGQPIGLGVVGSNSDRSLSTNPVIPGFDPAAFDQTGKVGLGDIDISDDGQYLFVMNLYSRRVFRLKLDNPANPTSVTEVVSYAVPDPGCTNGTYRPFGLKFYRNKLYVGVVCSAENSGGTNADLSAQIYELNDPTAAAAFNATAVITISNMTYDRQSSSDWKPWTNNSNQGASPIRFSQPILSGIEVNERGDMIMAFMDRAGNQYGNDNYKFLQVTTTTTDNHSAGEILIAGVDCSTGGFTVENNGQFTSNGVPFASNHAGTLPLIQGIGGREFFDDYSPANDPHAETTQGAVALLRGTGDVMASSFAIIPVLASDAGVSRFSSNDGTYVAGYALYGGTTGNFFGKAAGLGDLELMTPLSPIEIGNRVWMDTNDDGIQDAGEMGLGSITVKLYQGVTQVGETNTAADGSYYFDNSNVNLNGATGLLPNTAYVIRVDAADFPVGKSVSAKQNIGGAGQPDVRDNDAALNGVNAEIAVTTGKYGENNHTLDMAFKVLSCALNPADLTIPGLTFGPGSAPMSETVTINSGANLLPESNIAGFFGAATSEGALYTFCTEINQPLLPLQNPYTHQYNGAANGFTSAIALRIAQVVQAAGFNSTTGFGAGNNTIVNFVALQLAVWNAIYDTDYSVSNGAGTFYSTTNANGALATANGWLTTAQAITAPTVVVHNLHNATGQDLLKVGNPPATITVAVTAPTCAGAGAPNNAGITISNFTNQRYRYSTGTAFNAGSAIPASITAIPVGGVIATTLPNTSLNYTVRIYDAVDDNCYVDQVVTVTAVTCCALTAATKTLETCNNNGTTGTGADDYITFSLNPTGTGLGASYSVTADNGGMVTLVAGGAATGIFYGTPTAFRLQNGSSNGTLYTITVTDVSGAPCTATTTVQQSACSSSTCTPPVLTVNNSTTCAGNSTSLVSLVTGNAPAGTLSFHATQADADANTNALLNTTVAPASTTTYYVRSEVTSTCYSTASITVTVSSNPNPTVTTGSVCAGGSIDLATLVTSTGGGTLSFYTSQANANAGTNALGSSTVSPTTATNYYVCSTAAGCYGVKEITVTITPAACGTILSTGPN